MENTSIDKLERENAHLKSVILTAYQEISAMPNPSQDEAIGLLCTACFAARKQLVEYALNAAKKS